MKKLIPLLLPLLLSGCAGKYTTSVVSVQPKIRDGAVRYTVTMGDGQTYDIQRTADPISSARAYEAMKGKKRCFILNRHNYNLYGTCN